jgi:hypothetical protein
VLVALTACQRLPSNHPPLSSNYQVRTNLSAMAIADEKCGDWDESAHGKWRARLDGEVWYTWFDVGQPSGLALLDLHIDARDGRVLRACTMHAGMSQ